VAGEEGADAHHDVVEADGREADMIEKLDMASTEEQGVKDVANSLPAKLNICIMTQKLLMMFLVLPSPGRFGIFTIKRFFGGSGLLINLTNIFL
jgi:hypothetical protein